MTVDAYGYAIAELSGQEKRAAADLIVEAREKLRVSYARTFGEEVAGALNPA